MGKPIVRRPLENDVPGPDPTTPDARLQLAGDVTAPDNTTVETSIEAGTVTVTAGAPVNPSRARKAATTPVMAPQPEPSFTMVGWSMQRIIWLRGP